MFNLESGPAALLEGLGSGGFSAMDNMSAATASDAYIGFRLCGWDLVSKEALLQKQ